MYMKTFALFLTKPPDRVSSSNELSTIEFSTNELSTLKISTNELSTTTKTAQNSENPRKQISSQAKSLTSEQDLSVELNVLTVGDTSSLMLSDITQSAEAKEECHSDTRHSLL
ncbi:hypothetical protein BKA69DRAFT_1041411 [Paraphysoderma sedebokerense]|nr:hypothetical protein BKA69DRAFT_1041411 [Paraphysoderma sedebokerense]